MIRLYFGNDTIGARREALSYLEEKRAAGAMVITSDLPRFEIGAIKNAAAERSLFGAAAVYFFDTPSDYKDANEELLSALPDLAASPHEFVVIEGALLAEQKKLWQKHAESADEYKAAAAQRFNTFALTDAFLKRDRKSLWLIFSEARLSGISAEELAGVLWWQIKTLRLAELTTDAASAGVKDFPYQKAKRALAKFKPGETVRLSHSLLEVFHQSRLGDLELDLALERWALRV